MGAKIEYRPGLQLQHIQIIFKEGRWPFNKTDFMKRYLLSALGALVLLTACNSKPEVKKDDKAAAQVKSAATIVDPVTKKMDELKKMSPLGLDELSAWLPEKLNGIKR